MNRELGEALRELTAPGELLEKLDGSKVRCRACAHRCVLSEGQAGVCALRFNRGGTLMVPHGYVNGVGVDPIEKKPFYHVLPGRPTLSFGMLGCNFRCDFCQNWVTSQALREPVGRIPVQEIAPGRVVELARRSDSPVITSTYNEPVITAEWAVAIMREAKPKGIRGAFVSNGHVTPEALEYLRPWVDFYKIDLKGFDAKRYRDVTGGELKNVTAAIAKALELGFWVEVVTLVVPGFNDSDEELKALTGFLASCSKDLPWHVSAFHPQYRMEDRPATRAETLLRACEIGKAAGLNYVYAGNLPGHVGGWEHTVCPKCETLLVERLGYRIGKNVIAGGKCPNCSTDIPGVWT